MDNLSVYRNENKYIINEEQKLKIKDKLSKILKKDEFSKENGYKVRSLYFDSINNIDFNTKLAGTEIRKKIRLRIYNPKDEKCKLEIKQKNGNLSHKVSIWVSREDAKKIINADYSVLLNYAESKDAIYIYKLMMLGCYRPVAIIEYDRIAYTYPINDIRITFDMNVRSSETNFDIFDENIVLTPVLESQTILEVKYNHKLMGFISNTLKPYKLTQQSISKYCVGRINYYNYL